MPWRRDGLTHPIGKPASGMHPSAPPCQDSRKNPASGACGVLWLSASASGLVQRVQPLLPEPLQLWHHPLPSASRPPPSPAGDGYRVVVLDIEANTAGQAMRWLTSRELPLSKAHTLVLLPEGLSDQAVRWLDAGADRCLPQDSPPRLVLAMVLALSRRSQLQPPVLSQFGPLRFDHATQTLSHQSQRIMLTRRETQVARLMFQHGHELVKATDILHALQSSANTALVSLYVHRVNRKIRLYGVHIAHLRGYGYRLIDDASADGDIDLPGWLSPLSRLKQSPACLTN